MLDLKDIAVIKQKLIISYAQDKNIFECLKNNNSTIIEPTDLINKNIMPYFYNLNVEKEQKSYIFLRMYAPRLNDRVVEQFTLDVGIGVHKHIMPYKGGITRIDYLLPRIDKITSEYNNKYIDNDKKIGIDKVILRAVTPLSLYDSDYDGYMLTYTIDMLAKGECA